MCVESILFVLLFALGGSYLYQSRYPKEKAWREALFYSFLFGIGGLILSVGATLLLKLPLDAWSFVAPFLGVVFYNFFFLKGEIDRKGSIKLLVVLALFFYTSIFQLIPIYLFNINIDTMSATTSTMLTVFSDICLLAILIWIFWKDLYHDFFDLKKNFNQILDTSFKYWFVGLIVMAVSNILIATLIPQSVAGNEATVQSTLAASPFFTFIAAGFLAPLIEELTFRKAFQDAFKNKWLFILVSGIFFGSLHVVFSLTSLWDLFYLIPYSALGIGFAMILDKTKNVYGSILMHLFHNVVLLSLSLLTGMIILP